MTKKILPFNWIQWLTLLLTLTAAITIPILFARVSNVQAHQNDALHSIMCRAVTVIKKTPVSATFTQQQKTKAVQFYRSALADANLAPCDN